MIGRFKSTADLRSAARDASERLQEQLERELRERNLPIPFIRRGRLYKRTTDGIVAVS